jgi:hypothetical protein
LLGKQMGGAIVAEPMAKEVATDKGAPEGDFVVFNPGSLGLIAARCGVEELSPASTVDDALVDQHIVEHVAQSRPDRARRALKLRDLLGHVDPECARTYPLELSGKGDRRRTSNCLARVQLVDGRSRIEKLHIEPDTSRNAASDAFKREPTLQGHCSPRAVEAASSIITVSLRHSC